MKYFLDFEFIEDGKTIDPISVGIVAEDGREYYAVFREFNRVHFFSNQWLIDKVAPSLPFLKRKEKEPLTFGNYTEDYTSPVWKRRDEIRQDILAFTDIQEYGKPEFWAYYADYDWVTLCQIFGRMSDLPNGWPMYCNDLKQLAMSLGNPKLPKPEGEHNALHDARWNYAMYQHLIPSTSEYIPSYKRVEKMYERLGVGHTVHVSDCWERDCILVLEMILDRLDSLESRNSKEEERHDSR